MYHDLKILSSVGGHLVCCCDSAAVSMGFGLSAQIYAFHSFESVLRSGVAGSSLVILLFVF